ncbi:hypothetical protein IX39_07595 [Chryseobacterium formosense]|uniref:Bulb-type lectin domain-containing protein n=1 Tax=Chryseobacterium formosense TaxID=236814 RepID=A0A085Z7T6_9FLAO|nr:hypothetical protein [Chryseobacterium formosense]KFF00500.1 hypothetical protein IX39_07595 [Chryseobacterium formosense]SFT34419.1 hypothetical protein SAMN05421857_0220 [Chryseobacterium formosense]
MIKKLLLGALCIAQFSLISANDFTPNPIKDNGTGYFQNVPKSVIIKTKKFKVRIDKQPNGNYLYQSWGANTKITAKPAMIISNGELIPDGSGGNYYFEFNNNGTIYQVWRNYLTASAKKAPYTLVVIDQNGKTIVNQDAQIVKN